MSIQSEITRITSNVQSSISAIAATGVPVAPGSGSNELPALVAALVNMKQDKVIYDEITLGKSAWDTQTLLQTVAVTGVSADESAQMIFVSPAGSAQSIFHQAGIQCVAQGAGSLTFKAAITPTANDIALHIVILEV